MRSSFDQSTRPDAEPVFVDRTGRRRWLVAGVGLWLAIVLVGAIALLIAALTGASPVAIPGLPGSDRHEVARAEAGAVDPSPTDRRPSLRPEPLTSTPSPSAAASRAASPSSSPSPTGPPGHRRTTHPGNPKPSRSK